jgi:hypothetical protein
MLNVRAGLKTAGINMGLAGEELEFFINDTCSNVIPAEAHEALDVYVQEKCLEVANKMNTIKSIVDDDSIYSIVASVIEKGNGMSMREEFEQVCRDLCIEKPSRDYDLADAVWQACVEAAIPAEASAALEKICMARECGFEEISQDEWAGFSNTVESFASAIAALEREECAKMCDHQVDLQYATGGNDDAINEAMRCADAIRNKDKK